MVDRDDAHGSWGRRKLLELWVRPSKCDSSTRHYRKSFVLYIYQDDQLMAHQALIANCVFAPLILREEFHIRELMGMGLAILGAVTVVCSSSSTNPRVGVSEQI